jgi:SAM-dependent methyltransferase
VLKKLRRRLRPASKDQIHRYWKAPDDGSNLPQDYLDPKGGQARSEFLLSLIDLPKAASILEVGCNVGRNLNCLHKAGYTNLTGIELSEQAVEILRREFPHITDIRVGAAEDILPTLEQFDLVFTMAVLVHIHPTSEDAVFPELARIAKKLIVIEDERSNTWRHFRRQYRPIFEDLGMQQVHEVQPVGLPESYLARTFTHQ